MNRAALASTFTDAPGGDKKRLLMKKLTAGSPYQRRPNGSILPLLFARTQFAGSIRAFMALPLRLEGALELGSASGSVRG